MSPSPATTPNIPTPGAWNVSPYNTGNARQLTQQELQQIAQQGANLEGQDYNTYAQQMGLSSGTQDYLGDIENPLAAGQGGYNPQELNQIQMTPQEQEQIVSGAGISAGTATQAGADAAQRASAAVGGSPAATAAYRARAAQQSGAQAGQAMTQANVAASNAAAQRAEDIGQTRIAQQNQGLNYYQGLQSQQNANAQNALGLQEQAYGTQTSGTTAAANTALGASQTPTTFDKVMGGIGSALKSLDEGGFGTDAIVGENGPEKVVDLRHHDYMDDGGVASPESAPSADARAQEQRWLATASAPRMESGGVSASQTIPGKGRPIHIETNVKVKPKFMDDGGVSGGYSPLYGGAGSTQGIQTIDTPADSQAEYGNPAAVAGSSMPSFRDRLKALIAQGDQQAQARPQAGGAPGQPQGDPTPSSSVNQFGSGVGNLGKLAILGGLDSGGIVPPGAHPAFTGPQWQEQEQERNGIFTSPTHVSLGPNEAVVPLGYRAQAKVRPSMAKLPAARVRRPYGAAA